MVHNIYDNKINNYIIINERSLCNCGGNTTLMKKNKKIKIVI